ncbi:MAG: flagellar basal body rod protein FlgC [Bryobacteraceae bacterium]
MSLFSTLEVSASGMSAERTRAEVLVENIANANTTRTAQGGPYRRRDVVFQSEPADSPFSSAFGTAVQGGTEGVEVSQIVTDNGPPEMRYLPGSPDANKDGYVAYPRVNVAEDMVDLVQTSRAYDANVAAISSVKDMIARSIDLFR